MKRTDSLFTFFLEKIANQQALGIPCFPDGLLPAYRRNRSLGYVRPDTTLFFSAIVAFTLQSLRADLPPALREQVDKILEAIQKNYPAFRNKDGLKTYNFWKTTPSRHFPNGYLFRRFDHFRIPDDVDDTAFVYLTDSPTPQELDWLKDKLAQHANGSRLSIRNTYADYRGLRAYSTWFGKNMYVEFDACVLSNILYCIFYYKLPLNEHDTDSLQYIFSVIQTDRYRREPFRCAHQYPGTALIIYHVVRLMAAFDPPALRPLKAKLLHDAQALLDVETQPMTRVLLATSLLRLGATPSWLNTTRYEPSAFVGFRFFIAGLLTAYESPLLYRLASVGVFHMSWSCEAHCWALLLEYEVLHQQAIGGRQHAPAV